MLEGDLSDERNNQYIYILKKVKAELERKKFSFKFGWMDAFC